MKEKKERQDGDDERCKAGELLIRIERCVGWTLLQPWFLAILFTPSTLKNSYLNKRTIDVDEAINDTIMHTY
jgi:hypothetical protein